KVWIIASAGCTLLGWVLSAIGQLHALGYLAGTSVVGIAVVASVRWSTRSAAPGATKRSPSAMWHPLRLRRFRRGLPLLYLILLVLALVGGALYPPNNYDALTYRVPRVLHWLAAGHWLWIPTPNMRMNYSA